MRGNVADLTFLRLPRLQVPFPLAARVGNLGPDEFSRKPRRGPTQANVLGVLSLILWSLIIVISIKYLIFVMRADNNGEGGIIALTALPEQRCSCIRTRTAHRRPFCTTSSTTECSIDVSCCSAS